MIFLHEQINGMVSLDGTLSRLPVLNAWMHSSAVYWIDPSYPVSAMKFKVGNADRSAYSHALPAYYHPERGMWRVYIPARYLPAHTETSYKIESTDECGDRTVEGVGILRIHGDRVRDPDDMIPDVRKCYARFTDGVWRTVLLEEDEVGAPLFSVGEEVDPVETEVIPPFAYDSSRGRFFAVTGRMDETGTPVLSVADEPAIGGMDSFAVNDITGFYCRVEATTDTAGAVTLRTGEIKHL